MKVGHFKRNTDLHYFERTLIFRHSLFELIKKKLPCIYLIRTGLFYFKTNGSFKNATV